MLSLAAQCAPAVAPHTIAAIVQAESSNYLYAVNVNGLARQPRRPRSEAEAIATAKAYVERGHSVDMGLGQINSKNMRWLGLTWDTVFEPCVNVEAAGRVLLTNFRSVRDGRTPQQALRVALSMYNTGSQSRGFRNGYVARVELAGRRVSGLPTTGIPTLVALSAPPEAGEGSASAELNPEQIAAENTVAPAPPPPAWDVFARTAFVRANP
ncbi:lytic transglycosylase domain-containing protein [Novosphingobium sp. RD2P27]|uniref:Lytic transglycosylase domain-containing protein n=1 Tax=Novosphingobium kalidii TaxID=3230299 RepID=A0ABV2D3X4_9SPHN